MKEEFEWYAEHGKSDISYLVEFVNEEGRIDIMPSNLYDSETFKDYIKKHVKDLIKIGQFPDTEKVMTKLIFDMRELKRTHNIK